METFNFIKIFAVIFVFWGVLFSSVVSANNSSCPELPYLTTDFINDHKKLFQSQCMTKGYLDEKCAEIADDAYDKFMNCFEDCGGYGDVGCEHLSMLGDCSYYECTTNIDNNCAKKCKDYLFFNYNSSGKNNNEVDDVDINDDFDSNLIGLPVDPSNSVSPCIGKPPKNSKICPGDDENVLEYTEKHLVYSCSLPNGSEPKCEYFCKTEFLNNGTCKEEGFFKKILNWLGGLF